MIERQVDHLRRLLDDLLDVARITGGKLEIDLRPVELAHAVRDGLELASPLIEQRRHEVSVSVPPGLEVLGDGVRLAQIVSNLLTNAARYTDPGGTIAVTGERRDEEVVLRVSDDGIGMSPELVSRIFGAFVQAPRALDRGRGGLGLGLAIVKALVEAHGGRTHASSPGPGLGSVFEVVFPRPAPTGDRPRPEASAGPPKGLGTVLVVDDNVDAADLLALALARLGYATEVAYDPHEALALARRSAPDVAVLDLGLPHMDGYALARCFRAAPALEGVKLLALTGYGQPVDRERTADAGFLAHLVKPVDLEQLAAVVDALIARG